MQVFASKCMHVFMFIINKAAIKCWLYVSVFLFYVSAKISECQFSVTVSILWADILTDVVVLPKLFTLH